MTSRERMLSALMREKPDRVPATVHQWQPYHLSAYLGGISDIEAFRRFGLDASIARFPLVPESHEDWREEVVELDAPKGERQFRVTVTTPDGQLDYELGRNEITQWITRHMLRRPEDLELIDRYLPVPRLDREALKRERQELGNDGILRGFIFGDQGGCWQHAACLMGTVELIMAASDDPAWVHELLRSLLRKKERFIEESLDGAAYDLVETGGGAASSTVISPAFFREFCLPYDLEMHRMIHSLGLPVVYHTCGGMMPILELISENECDACETLTPPTMGGDARPAELKARVGKRLALIGGLDQNTVLEVGTPEDIRAHVHAMFDAYGPNGGYIMSPSDHFFHVPPCNLEAYAAAVRECRYV